MHYMHHEGSFQQARPFSVELLPNEPGEFTFALCVPKIRFCNSDGEGHRERVVM